MNTRLVPGSRSECRLRWAVVHSLVLIPPCGRRHGRTRHISDREVRASLVPVSRTRIYGTQKDVLGCATADAVRLRCCDRLLVCYETLAAFR
jgi:hypothetical protein